MMPSTLNPKLPPKWEWKRVEALLCDLPRSYVAAIVEVEWRKRAKRWHDIQDRVFQRWLIECEKTKHGREDPALPDRHAKASKAADDCYDIAKQWREWGK